MRQTGMRLLLLIPLLLLAACGSSPGDGGVASPPSSGDDALAGGSQQADNDLVVEIDRGDGAAPERYTLTCVGFVDGDLPDAEAACRHLEGLDEPFAPLPEDMICTEIYGGPQTARVTGLWRGEPVDVELSRTNGCTIAQWDSLGPLLPGPVGVELPPTDAPQ